jgi:hypothetical protein
MVSKADLKTEKITQKVAEVRYHFKCILGLVKNKK